ncbi:EAL domain-containing protein [Agarivorans sp. QJM3NY_33]|uniref:EAL domain-containing protein n=1 Tax=Agarivorans sp. QJM3NY_33 TaxID=3421432 RepID=UPI003D7D0A42
MQEIKQRVVVTASGILMGTLAMFISLFLLSKDISKSQQYYANESLGLAQAVIYESLQTLETLNSLEHHDCGKDLLIKIRQIVFLSNFIKDIGVLQEDKLLCTSIGGPLTEPIVVVPPDFTSKQGLDVWLNQKLIALNRLNSGLIMKKDQFNVVIANTTFANLDYGDNYWEMVSGFKGQYRHISGTPELFRQVGRDNDSEVTLSYHYFHQCNSTYQFCIALKLYNSSLVKNRLTFLLLSLLLSVTVGVISSMLAVTLIKRHLSVNARLRRGLKKGYFYYQIQPLVDLKTQQIIGGEVLARFTDPHGSLTPEEFIPLLPKLRMTWPFTLHIIKGALTELQASQAMQASTKISFNIFPLDVETNRIAELRQQPEIEQFSGNITLEITEDLQLDGLNARRNINLIIQQGFEVAIDDFGTGYSNLKQLKHFRCHYLKIDKSFVCELANGTVRSSLIPHIVDIARQSKLKIVAEGIENEMQAEALRDLKVEYGQGQMFGEAMAISDFVALYLASQQQTK